MFKENNSHQVKFSKVETINTIIKVVPIIAAIIIGFYSMVGKWETHIAVSNQKVEQLVESQKNNTQSISDNTRAISDLTRIVDRHVGHTP